MLVPRANLLLGNIGQAQQLSAADLDRRELEIRNPNLARQLSDPNFAAVAHDDLDSLGRIEQGAGTSLVARTLGLGENAAKVLTALGVGSAFTASQGGRTFTQMAASGKSDDQARHDADVVAAINAVPNMAMGLTDFVPGLRDYPLLSALGVGGATGAAGQLAQNRVTGQPLTTDLAKGAIEGAAVQGGMHLGFDFLGQMADTVSAVEASKLRTRSPEKFQQLNDAVFDGDPSVRVPAQEFVDYFAKKNIDPAAMANQLGATNLEEAAAAGSDLEIPKANFFGKLDPEHQKGLLPDVVDPATDMTARQAEAGGAELKDWVADGGVEKLVSEFQQADAETQATPEWQKVKNELKQRYVDAGETDPVADKYATLQANAISYFAKNTGMKPGEVLKLHNPQIVQGEAPGTAEAAGPVLHQQAIEDIRSVVEAAKEEGHAPQKAVIAPAEPWLVEAAKEHGLDLADHNHVIDGSAVRHVINRHGDEKVELSRGQLPVMDADFEKIPDMVAAPDAVVFGTKTKGNRDQIGYIKRLDDGSSLYLEEVRTGKKELAAVSMRKYPAARDFDSIAETLPSNAQSDGGRTATIINGPGLNAEKNETLYQTGGDRRKARNLEAARIQGEMLKGAPEGTRGWFRMRPDGSAEIGKTKISDFSTFIHEPAHGYLELFRTMTQRADASDQLKADFSKICEWLGTTPEEVYKNGFTRKQHEQWARANEQYVREGKAPTSALQHVFHGFGVWLQRIYRQAKSLGVEMSPDIHGVMDRLYAGETAVDRAAQESPRQQLLERPEDSGWTKEAQVHGIIHKNAMLEIRIQR